jgi:hypothetical protein
MKIAAERVMPKKVMAMTIVTAMMNTTASPGRIATVDSGFFTLTLIHVGPLNTLTGHAAP